MGLGDYFNKFLSAKGQGQNIRNNAIFTGISLLVLSILLIPLLNVEGLVIAKIFSSIIYFTLMLKSYFNYIKEDQNYD